MSQIDHRSSRRPASTVRATSRSLRRIVWPSVAGTTFALATLSVIGALKTFDIP